MKKALLFLAALIVAATPVLAGEAKDGEFKATGWIVDAQCGWSAAEHGQPQQWRRRYLRRPRRHRCGGGVPDVRQPRRLVRVFGPRLLDGAVPEPPTPVPRRSGFLPVLLLRSQHA